jgi:RHS repeat-associated protein
MFTTKDFDEVGDANGAPGSDAYHFGFRVYDPEIGIFLSSDPMDVFWNSYSYNGGDPVNFVDPYGLSPIDITVGSVLQDLSYLEGVGMQLAMDLESIASLFNGIASTTVSFERTANNITMIGDLSLSEYAYVNYMETAFSNSLPPISLTNYTGAIATPAVTPIATTVSNEIVQPARSRLWSGRKDVGYGTAQVTFGVFLLSTALAQEAAPTGITQATGLVTGAAGAWYLVGGVGSLGIGAGKISLGLQNPDLMDNVFPTSPPILDMLYTPGYPQATEDLIRGCTRNDKK